MAPFRCPHCSLPKPTVRAVNMHLFANRDCFLKWQKELTAQNNTMSVPLVQKRASPPIETATPDEDEFMTEFQLPFEPPVSTPPDKRPRVEDIEDEGNSPSASHNDRYICPYPAPAGSWISQGETKFEGLKKWLEKSNKSPWEPFESEEEWELAMWLLKNVGQKSTDEYLKLPIVRNARNLSFHNNYSFLKKIDKLPTGPSWKCEVVTVHGDLVGGDGEFLTEDLELWFRDPVDIVKELIGNPAFKEMMAYLPEQVFHDEACTERVYDEMWTADWWWNLQKELPTGATIAPIILSSDKTQLSQFRGDQKAWPVYLTIGNISKDLRRQPSAHATILLGYLPTAKLECCSDGTRSLAGYRAFHRCMSIIVESLVEAGKNGVEMVCADGLVRLVYLILAAYVADYPEQCLIACCQENRCPRCLVSPTERGSPVQSLLRNVNDTLRTLQEHKRGQGPPQFEKNGLRAVYQPFWHNLPHCNIFQCFTPDLLHQLHKGVFKDHFVKWCTKILGTKEVDRRFKAMADHPGLRHFKKGISTISQWTGTEHKEMEKVMMGVLAGGVNSKVLTVARALLDFIFYSQYQRHTSSTLSALEASLKTFHDNKDIFIELQCREDFNIPKLHSLNHYVEAIRALGTADGYNTESPERLHIDLAKEAYRASNKRDYSEQMVLWLQRREAMWIRKDFCDWLQGRRPGEENVEDGDGDDDDDEGTDGDNEQMFVDVVSPSSLSPPPSTASFAVAKAAPSKNISIGTLTADYGAIDFISALERFLRAHVPGSLPPNQLDRFNLYKQVIVTLPRNPIIGERSLTNRIRTTPQVKPQGRKQGSPAHFDVALIVEDEGEYRRLGGLAGLRVAQVRVIFELPSHLGMYPHPLAYVEWFTPLGQPNPITGLYTISRSTRHHRRNAAIISVSKIIRGCHLMAKCGSKMDSRWTAYNVLDLATHFYFNPYIHVDTFSIIK